jgi:tetratricopeptide (TPR) repeat protein
MAASDRTHAHEAFQHANALLALGRRVEAAESLVRCLHAAPEFGPAHVNLADTLRGFGFLAQAVPFAEAGCRLLPDEPAALLCLANCRHDGGEYAAAEALYQQVLALVPGHAGALTSLGNTLAVLGRLDEAIALHDRAVAAAPQDADIRFNRAAALLAAGDFARGWADYEWRLCRPGEQPRALGALWQGEPLAGRTILLHAEQGLGDTLQFVRYAPLVAERGGRVVLEVQRGLARLLARLSGVAEVVTRGEPLPAYDLHCPLLSLPHRFATTLATVPAEVPYLLADPADVAAWGARLPADGRLRVGLVWAGSSHRDDPGAQAIDRRRSLALTELAPLAAVPGVQFISLQRDAPAEQLRAPPPAFSAFDPMADVHDFADTAALVANLDLVISVDTAVAHLAGALGRQVWLLSRYDGCWRWLAGRDDSPWYPGMRVYRQQRPHHWADVVARLCADLTRAARR